MTRVTRAAPTGKRRYKAASPRAGARWSRRGGIPIGASQSPDDAAFAARDFRLEDDDEDQKIEIYLDQDNLVSQGDGSIVIRVLGLTIEVNSRTRLFDDKGGAGSGGDDNDDNGGDDHGSDDD